MIDFNNAADEFLRVMAPDEGILFVALPDKRGNGWTKHRFGTWEGLKRILLADNGKPQQGIFWTVNVTEGERRRTEDVSRVRAFFIDMDDPANGGIQAVLAHAVKPHAIVNTSHGKYHAYWKVDDCPLAAFEPIQQELIKKFGADKACFDAPRIMRLPGTMHNKNSPPTKVELIQLNDFPAYKTKDFYRQMDLHCNDQQVEEARQRMFPIARACNGQEQENFLKYKLVEDSLGALGMLQKQPNGRIREILCPWAKEHTPGQFQSYGAALILPTAFTSFNGGFRCHHTSCKGRGMKELINWLTENITGEKE